MKKIKLLAIAIIFIQLSACQKFVERIFPGHTHNDNLGCTIKHITGLSSPDQEVMATIEYNEAKNPISFTYNIEARYLLYLHYMFYDSLNRLTGYKVFYDNDTEIEDHRYGYSGNRIVADTMTGHLTGYIKILSTFEYDTAGRIVVENRKILDFEGDPGTWEDLDPSIYTYDANGNKVHGDDTYDDKVNFRRTNKIWMFLTRNYSRNNLVGAVEYNERDLPVRFDNTKDFLFDTGLSSIEYDCQF